MVDQAFELKKKSGPALRWIILILISMVIAGNYYVYDVMSSIKSVMQAELGINNTQFGLFVSLYSFPNTFLLMAVLGGIILDKWGIRKTGFLFVLFCTLGAILTAIGSSEAFQNDTLIRPFFDSFLTEWSPEFKVIMLGRLLFGLGAETSIVVINKILVKWFKGKELATAFAINVAIARIGTAGALILSPVMVESQAGWESALWLAAVLMGVGFIFFIVYMGFDKKKDKEEGEMDISAPEEEFQWSDIGKLITNKSYIYVIFLCVTFYSAVFPFLAYCPDLLHNKYGVTLEFSGTLSSLVIWGTIVFTPLFGWFVDKRGKRATLMIWGSLLLVVVHLILSLTHLTPYIPMFLLGIAFSLVPAAMWPSVALIVDEKRLGTAYGMMASLQNLGLFAFPALAGYILDTTNPGVTAEMVKAGEASFDYTYTVLMFAGLGIVGLLFSFLLKREDSKTSGFDLEKGAID